MPVMKPARHPIMRIAQLTLGVLLIIGAAVMGPLPGPGGIFLFAGGAALLIKNSNWVKRHYARFGRNHPKYARFCDKALRRRPAPRGRPKTPRLD